MEDPHESIKQKQIKESLKYMNHKPSKCKKVYWIYATRKFGIYPESTPESGKFLIFCPPNEINDIWSKIKDLTERGLLGDASKVSTKIAYKIRKHQKKTFDQHVICVYTYSDLDTIDKDKIKQNIFGIVGHHNIHYKTNKQTLAHINNHTNVVNHEPIT
jgi:hypothetical protein